MNNFRTLLIGCEYTFPPKQNKLNPFVERAECVEFSPKWLVDTFADILPCTELFYKVQKAKKSILHLEEQIEITNHEITYLENIIHQLETATPSDIQEIREELVGEKYLKAKYSKKKKSSSKPTLERYVATDGTEILVGKNNIQNEYLTMKLASRFHTWLHTKDIPGSHVVILSDSPTEETIHEAAILSAYFSKARESNQVPVDFTLIKHVKKPSGAKPGFVNYFHQKTVYVSPSVEKVREMLK